VIAIKKELCGEMKGSPALKWTSISTFTLVYLPFKEIEDLLGFRGRVDAQG
jgi:hypothetical protein